MATTKLFESKEKFSIDSFKDLIVDKGISASNLYSFEIQGTDALKGYMKTNIRHRYSNKVSQAEDPFTSGQYKLNMVCNEIQIPGVDMTASDVKSPYKGLTQKMVSGKVYNELDVQFYCDLNSTPLSFFRAWQDMIMGNQHVQNVLGYKTGKVSGKDGAYEKDSNFHKTHQAYAQQYYDDYTSNIIISKLEKYGVAKKPKYNQVENKYDFIRPEEWDVSFKASLMNAYPYSMSSVPYSFGQSELVRVSVGFYYEYQTFQFSYPTPTTN